MKRKSGKAMVDFGGKVTVVHLNVGSGYLTFLEEDAAGSPPRVHNIVIEKPRAREATA